MTAPSSAGRLGDPRAGRPRRLPHLGGERLALVALGLDDDPLRARRAHERARLRAVVADQAARTSAGGGYQRAGSSARPAR